ncbi:hypothetical protein [Agaribacter flavus]|uniref:YtkA-like domain-containing protein n=1 Tax=Agaribacter flavus TaxID=1902781 RepID=A0ABV7FT72_9ALTE
MNKKTISGLVILATFLCLVLLSEYKQVGVNDVLNRDSACRLQSNQCEITSKYGAISINFKQMPISEEMLSIVFSLPSGYQINSAHIEGVNMYMGRTPVMFEQGKKINEGTTFLGSCNIEEMQWQLQFTIKKGEEFVSSPFSVFFITRN